MIIIKIKPITAHMTAVNILHTVLLVAAAVVTSGSLIVVVDAGLVDYVS